MRFGRTIDKFQQREIRKGFSFRRIILSANRGRNEGGTITGRETSCLAVVTTLARDEDGLNAEGKTYRF